MSIEEIINGLDNIAREKQAKNAGLPDGWPLDTGLLDDETVLREAIAIIRTHTDAQPNEPLTLEELKQMYCQAVWVDYEDGYHGSWGLVELGKITLPAGAYCIIREEGFDEAGWKAYRRPPKEDKR